MHVPTVAVVVVVVGGWGEPPDGTLQPTRCATCVRCASVEESARAASLGAPCVPVALGPPQRTPPGQRRSASAVDFELRLLDNLCDKWAAATQAYTQAHK